MAQRPHNDNIRIGSIFKNTTRDECGSGCSFYQVVGLRGKTLVELRAIREETYAEKIDGRTTVKTLPLPGQFCENSEPFLVRACGPSEIDGQQWLQGRGEDNWLFYSEMREGEMGQLYGYDAVYALIQLEKEGKLPS